MNRVIASLAVAGALMIPAMIGSSASAAPNCPAPVGSGNTVGSAILAREAQVGDRNLTLARKASRGSLPAGGYVIQTNGTFVGYVVEGGDSGTMRLDRAQGGLAAGSRVCVLGTS